MHIPHGCAQLTIRAAQSIYDILCGFCIGGFDINGELEFVLIFFLYIINYKKTTCNCISEWRLLQHIRSVLEYSMRRITRHSILFFCSASAVSK